MIIKKVNVIAFGGIKNKEIYFDKGINVVYGENEKGKSTIQNFIRIWLFGISNKRGRDLKNNERVRFSPVSGEKIAGELYVINAGVEYIIKRTFGATKKEDTSEILDALTGETVKEISNTEPGKYFLGVNASTFLKTLFIGQLGVTVSKDKEEEMMERAANLLGSGDENVSVKKAMERLELLKKSLTTSRKNGTLDILKNKYSELSEEKFEGYKLSKENIDDENKSIELKNKRESIRKELNNLEIYKKYMKKVKLQKEYEDITEYLKKSEALKREQESIEESITTTEGIIDETAITSIKEEHSLFLNILNLRSEAEERLKEHLTNYNNKREDFKELLFVERLDENIKERLIRITLEQESLKDKIDRWVKISEEIKLMKNNIYREEKSIGTSIDIKKMRENIGVLLKSYEEKLKELKFIMESSSDSINNNLDVNKVEKSFLINRNLLIGSLTIAILCLILLQKNIFIIVPLIIVSAYFGKRVFDLGIEIKSLKDAKQGKGYLGKLNFEIEDIEKKLFHYKNSLGVDSYEKFIRKLKEYDDFVFYKERETFKITEKEKEIASIDINSIREVYNSNLIEIRGVLEIAQIPDVNKVIEMITQYEAVNKTILSHRIEIDKQKEDIIRFTEEIEIREERIKNKLNSIGLVDIDLEKLEDKLHELKDKLDKRNDLKKSLEMIDQTYNILTKDKDIDLIKEELKDIISQDIKYSYKSEDEIDSQIRNKSNELIEVEKDIKDVENLIATRFIGRRELPIIEEELEETKTNIENQEIRLKAIELAMSKLDEAFRDVRGNFGPLLNEKVVYYFKKLTENKYREVLVSDSYEMKVRDKDSLLSAELLSNGANDQLYLSLRLAFISMLYKEDKVPVILDDAFIQYDDKRVEQVLEILIGINFSQLIIFTCQNREKEILDRKNTITTYIYL